MRYTCVHCELAPDPGNAQEELIRLKLSFTDRRKKPTAKWTNTNSRNPLAPPDSDAHLAWTAQGWEELWDAYSRLERPHLQQPPSETKGKPPPEGVYVVQKVCLKNARYNIMIDTTCCCPRVHQCASASSECAALSKSTCYPAPHACKPTRAHALVHLVHTLTQTSLFH